MSCGRKHLELKNAAYVSVNPYGQIDAMDPASGKILSSTQLIESTVDGKPAQGFAVYDFTPPITPEDSTLRDADGSLVDEVSVSCELDSALNPDFAGDVIKAK